MQEQIYMVQTVVLLNIFLETVMFLLQDTLINRKIINTKSKEQYLFKIELFCNIIRIFTVYFDNFNVFLLIESKK